MMEDYAYNPRDAFEIHIASNCRASRRCWHRLNPVIDLLEQHQSVFGLYAPSNGGRRGEPTTNRPASELAKDALAFKNADFLFNGSMEGGVDRGLSAATDFVTALGQAAGSSKAPYFGLAHPYVVKTPKIDPDRAKAVENISRELNIGAAGIMFVETESAEEVRQGLAAMRFKSKGGTRPDDVGIAPTIWSMSEQEYRQKADLWPLNPEGELINWTIVESKEGLKPGERIFDADAWENAIQRVLAACKEFHVPCGYPANAGDIKMRLKQGFSVFVMNWGDAGFKTIELGRAAADRRK